MPLPQPTKNTTLMEFYRVLCAVFPIVNGKHLECTFSVSDGTTKTFAHGLGRPWQGAFVVASTAAGTTVPTIGAPFGAGAITDEIFISLSVAADVTLRLWVY